METKTGFSLLSLHFKDVDNELSTNFMIKIIPQKRSSVKELIFDWADKTNIYKKSFETFSEIGRKFEK